MGSSINFVLPEGFEAVADELGRARAAARPPKPMRRGTLLGAAMVAVEAGQLPPPLVFKSANGKGYNWHAVALRRMAEMRNLAGLKAYPPFGVNTYGKALAGYRDLLMVHVERSDENVAPVAQVEWIAQRRVWN